MKKDKIGFIGLGLIGGSIALRCKQLYPDSSIIATSHGPATIKTAHEMGIIDNDKPLDLAAFHDCDLIFLCAPVEDNIAYLDRLKDVLRDGAILTDVGSTKTKIHERVHELGMERCFIGGHPMTGSEKTGIECANPLILENAYYIITPTEETKKEDLDDFTSMVRAFGCIPYMLDYRSHDRATAAVSHLPHMIAFSLINMVKEVDDERETMKTIAAGGFRDTTRIAASSPAMWESITSSNRGPILDMMDRYMQAFRELRDEIADYDADGLFSYFADAKEYRDSLNVPKKNKTLVYDIYVDLNDETGQIAIVASIIAFAGISIKNIGIINNREFSEGVLRIEFYDEKAREKAVEILKGRNYKIYLR